MTQQTVLTSKQAYAAMFFFLEMMYESTQSEELAGLLGSLSLLEDGSPADGAMEKEWAQAVTMALEKGTAPSL